MQNLPALLQFCNTDRQREILQAVISIGTITQAAKSLGINRRTVQQTIQNVERLAAARLYSPEHYLDDPLPEGFVGGYTLQLGRDKETGGMNKERIWLKAKSDDLARQQMFIAFVEGLATTIKRAKPIKAPKGLSTKLASAIIFGDAHLGMLAHAIETMGEDYDLEKGVADVRAAVDYCIDCAPASEEGWFVNVGDFTHADDTKNQTPDHGNRMDVGQRHFQTMTAAGHLMRYCIDRMLTKFGKVRVINARGNHDPHTAFALNLYCQGVYEKEPRVIIDTNQSKFCFIEFGKCLIGINHGDKINADRLAGVMTRNQASAWGRTTHKRWWIGHIHHKQVIEHTSGVTIESFHTLAPMDAWHSEHGYGAERRVTMITLHKDFGEQNRMTPTLEMIRAFAA